MSLVFILSVVIFGSLLAMPRPAAADEAKRIAILIANATYPDANLPQQSAIKDANLLAEELRHDSFDTDLRTDLNREKMRAAVDGFLARIKPGTTALLYFNGIGIQVAHQTYLIPTDAEIWSEADVKHEGIGVDGIVADMNQRGAVVKIVIIDAARRNPFERRFRAYSAGLAGIDAPDNTLVMYAAAPNKAEPDGTGDVSLFMNELVKEMRTPNISAEDAIMHTRVGVSRASNGEQVPWFASSLVDQVYFGPTHEAPGTPVPPVPPAPTPAAQAPPVHDPVAAANPSPSPSSPPAAPSQPARSPPPPDVAATNAPLPPVETASPPAASAPAPSPSSPSPPAAIDAPAQPPAAAVPPPPAAASPPSTSEPTSPPQAGAPSAEPEAAPENPEETKQDKPQSEMPGTTSSVPLPDTPASVTDENPGTIFRDCPDCPEMMVLPAGAFLMGSGATPFDRPPHRVTLGKPFAIARAEVTFDDWARCLADGGCGPKPDNQGFGEGQHPVINVSWSDAKAFVAWIAQKTGKRYRLPTEAEWEYAARGGTNTVFAWGAMLGKGMANCSDCGNADATPHTTPARSFPANGYGLYDMAGNAAEWVEDCWNPSYRGAPKDGSAWLSGNCEQRVLRGGSFDSGSAYIKPAARFRYDSDVRYWANGFRVVRELP